MSSVLRSCNVKTQICVTRPQCVRLIVITSDMIAVRKNIGFSCRMILYLGEMSNLISSDCSPFDQMVWCINYVWDFCAEVPGSYLAWVIGFPHSFFFFGWFSIILPGQCQDTSWLGHGCFFPNPSWFCHQPPSIRYYIIFITDSIVNWTTKNNILLENIVCAYLHMFCWQHSKHYSDSSLLVISHIWFLFLFHWW